MVLNPYYYAFVKVFKKLKGINVQDEGILFSSYAVLFILFVPHFFLLLFQLKDYEVLTFNVNIPKQLFGVGFALGFWLINYLLFERGHRYVKVVECYERTSKILKHINLMFLIIYFLIPFVLMVA